MLKARGLIKSFDGKRAVSGVDINAAPGQISVVVGPSGSGKSTLLRCLSLIDPADQGHLCIDDFKFSFPLGEATTREAVWPYLTMVYQQLFLWPHMTIHKNVTLPIRHVLSERKDKIRHLTERFGISNLMDRYPNEISVGQRQRAALVRAIVLEPRYLILDEVTSALDVEQIGILAGEIRALSKNDTGVIMVTHMLGFAKTIADQIIFLDEGRVVESGPTSILDDPKSERLAHFVGFLDAHTE